MNPLENPLTEVLINKPGKKKWPDCRSMVNVVFLDGEVREYEISASSHLSKYLVEQASETGILCFIDKRQKASLSIPVANIREWSLKEIEEQKPQLTDDWVDTFAEPEIEKAPAEPAPENQPHCIDGLSDKIMDAMESKALGVNTNQMLKTKAINIVETELRNHGAAAILKRSTRDWIRVDQVGEKAAMFIRSALFDLRKQNR